MNYGHPTTLRHPRTMRKSGTEMANAIEHYKRRDISGQIIVFAGCAAVMALTFFMCWRSI